VGRGGKFVVMDLYRNERREGEPDVLQLTCECMFTPWEWEFIFQQTAYTGDWILFVLNDPVHANQHDYRHKKILLRFAFHSVICG